MGAREWDEGGWELQQGILLSQVEGRMEEAKLTTTPFVQARIRKRGGSGSIQGASNGPAKPHPCPTHTCIVLHVSARRTGRPHGLGASCAARLSWRRTNWAWARRRGCLSPFLLMQGLAAGTTPPAVCARSRTDDRALPGSFRRLPPIGGAGAVDTQAYTLLQEQWHRMLCGVVEINRELAV